MSWAEFSQAIFAERVKAGVLPQQPKVNFIATEQYPTPAQRPAYSVLSVDKISRFYPASYWNLALTKIISSL